jgi:O-acetyl-ADP-ribose deacetylase (regulator of RNase III)
LEKDEIKSIALPQLATGVGGLEWSEVLPLIRTNLGDLEIPVYVYSHYKKGVQANEPGV